MTVPPTTPGPPLPPELNHDLLGELGWLIGNETSSIKRAADTLDRAKREGLGFDEHWDAVLAILGHCAVLSRIFWPMSPKPAIRIRGEFLRSLFEVHSGSSLNEASRVVRNTIEHWDERLDKDSWYLDIKTRKQTWLFIGSFTNLDQTSYVLRAFDPTTDTARAGTDELALRPLVEEAAKVYSRYCQVVNFMVRGEPIWHYPPDLYIGPVVPPGPPAE